MIYITLIYYRIIEHDYRFFTIENDIDDKSLTITYNAFTAEEGDPVPAAKPWKYRRCLPPFLRLQLQRLSSSEDLHPRYPLSVFAVNQKGTV